ncbi:glutaredoxin domain-containing protein [Oceanobacillus longus]|uniref:Glutaredoxin domain-containing protein n=1 Tax=Oceanobacillus longus TaxID=930120 RepID=A0ABV8H348_9BACI
MSNNQVIIYISNNNSIQSNKVINLMNEHNIPFITKNVSDNTEHMKELQAKEIYGTPATYIDDQKVILGYQKNKIKHALGLDDNTSHYSSLFEGFDK